MNVLQVIGRLRGNGIGAILDYAAEADVAEISAAFPATENVVAEKASTIPSSVPLESGSPIWRAQIATVRQKLTNSFEKDDFWRFELNERT